MVNGRKSQEFLLVVGDSCGGLERQAKMASNMLAFFQSAAQPFGSSKTVWLTASLKLVEVAWSSREGAASWWA